MSMENNFSATGWFFHVVEYTDPDAPLPEMRYSITGKCIPIKVRDVGLTGKIVNSGRCLVARC